MQTFLPFASFIHSVECLDDRRLNKQGERGAYCRIQPGNGKGVG